MTAPVVLDIEFLARTALNFDRKSKNNRVAYFAGLVCGLEIAKVFLTAQVTDVEPEFWTVLDGTAYPVQSTADFVGTLCTTTIPNLKFDVKQVPESGLRLGQPGQFYSQGIRDATKVAITQVPVFFKYAEGDDWLPYTLKWIGAKLSWARESLSKEILKIQDFIF